ncbi:hypothetical protein C6497_13845 [Candidatus Poribacteria bacterium]|nr:MAG: hypothetical protein C6497_13845 [Candidatus Poribacteria bacterium]
MMSEQIRTDIKGIERFVFEAGTDPERLHLHISEVDPGQRAHAPHTHDGLEIFYVFSGEGEVLFGDKKHLISDNQAIQVDCKVLHGIRNVGETKLKYAVIIAR